MKTLHLNLNLDRTLPDIDLPLDEHVKIVVHPPSVHVLELASVSFDSNREVLLPDAHSRPDDEPGPARVPATEVLGAAFTFLDQHPEKFVLAVGHTDTVGRDKDNEVLSNDRAENLRLFFSGDHDAWAAHASEHGEVADIQHVLLWADAQFGFACAPGPIDNETGPMTQSAIAALRRGYADLFAEQLGTDEPWDHADWVATARLYDEAIGQLVGDSDLTQRVRARVRFAGPGALGLGERYPTENPDQDDLDSERNRRVELIFLDTTEAEFLTDGQACERYLYEHAEAVERTWLPVSFPASPNQLALEIVDTRGDPVSFVRCRVTTQAGEALEATTDKRGVAVFGGLARGTCEVRLEGLEAADWDADDDAPRTLPEPPAEDHDEAEGTFDDEYEVEPTEDQRRVLDLDGDDFEDEGQSP